MTSFMPQTNCHRFEHNHPPAATRHPRDEDQQLAAPLDVRREDLGLAVGTQPLRNARANGGGRDREEAAEGGEARMDGQDG